MTGSGDGLDADLGSKRGNWGGTSRAKMGAGRDEPGRGGRTSFLFKGKDLGCSLQPQVKQRRKVTPLLFTEGPSGTVLGVD